MPLPHGGHAPEATSRIEHNAVAEAKRVELVGFTGTEYVTVQVDASGVVSVTGTTTMGGGFVGIQSVPTLFAVVNTAAGSGGGGTQYPWGGGATIGALGNLALAYRNDALAITPVTGDQQFTPLSADSVGRLRVNPSYSVAESGAHVVGTTPSILNCIAGVRHDADTALTDATDEHAVFLFNDLQHLKVSGQGNVGHDDPDSGRPLKLGGRARTAEPSAVANDDRVDAFFDATGHLHVKVDRASVPTLFSISSITGFVGVQSVPTVFGIHSVTGFVGLHSVPTIFGSVSGVVGATVPTIYGLVGGAAAHDAAYAGNPIPVGLYASDGTAPRVNLGDIVRSWGDTFGRFVTIEGHPTPEIPIKKNLGDGISTGTTSVCVITAPTSPTLILSLYLQQVKVVHTGGTSPMFTNLQENQNGTNRWDLMTTVAGDKDFTIFKPWYKLPNTTGLWAKLGPASVSAQTARLEVQYFIAPE